MGIRMTTKMSEVNAYLKAEAERIQRLTIRALSYLGEQCVRVARDRAPELSWIDQTGNLRSSIGYIITHNKLTMNTGFDLEKLKAELEMLKLTNIDLELTGFERTELEDIMSDETELNLLPQYSQ